MSGIKNKQNFILQEIRDIVILVLITTLVTYFFAGSNLFFNLKLYLKSIFYGFIVGWTIWKGNQILGYYLDKFFPWKDKPARTLTIHLSASVIYTSLDIVIVNYLIYSYVFNYNMFDDLRRFFYFASIQFGIAMLITTIFYVIQFFKFWRESAINEERLKKEALSMQYETLKSYVNPHFLFNSLSVLSSLVEKDTAKSQEFIRQLSDIYRYVLEQKDKELVPLNTELEFIKSYINLFRIRHGDNLIVDLKVDDTSGNIVPLSLQILLENAFKHNIISADEPLLVRIFREGNYLVVQNKLQTRKTINQNGGIGLDTLIKQYDFLTRQPVVIEREKDVFTVKIPIIDFTILDGYR